MRGASAFLALALVAGCGAGNERPSTGKRNGKIAYTAFVCGPGTSGLPNHLYVINADGSGDRQLKGFGGRGPNWSPDGTSIAFARWDGEGVGGSPEGRPGLALVNPNGTGLKMLTRGFVHDPAWSPDGTRIAFGMTERGSGTRLVVRNADGRISRFTSGVNPTWSPDGTRLAFDRGDAIYVMNADGSETKRLGPGVSPDWSPDGEDILFTLYSPGTAYPENRIPDIYVMNTNGEERRRLTQGPSGEAWDGWSRDGSWSPDGKEIVFVSSRSEDELEGIWTLRADGSDARMIRLEEYCSLGDPDWQPLETGR